jgi:hypothetical protein
MQTRPLQQSDSTKEFGRQHDSLQGKRNCFSAVDMAASTIIHLPVHSVLTSLPTTANTLPTKDNLSIKNEATLYREQPPYKE